MKPKENAEAESRLSVETKSSEAKESRGNSPSKTYYEAISRHRQALANLIQKTRVITQRLGNHLWSSNLNSLLERTLGDNFKVIVLGEFKNGKSTFINAMLGKQLLPTDVTPTTAVINELKWGEEPRAIVYEKKRGKNKEAEPLEIAVSDLEKYVVIPDQEEEETNGIQKNPYEKVELFWPLRLLENGVEIIDSPGLNEHDVREKLALDYLSKVDAVLFVMSCLAFPSASELNVIDNIIIPSGHNDVFFICNRFDQIREGERDRVKKHAEKLLRSRTNQSAERIFLLSALDALQGRTKKDKTRVSDSGIEVLESTLQKFLTRERGRIKYFRIASALRETLKRARMGVIEEEGLAKANFEELKKRYDVSRESLEILRRKIQLISMEIDRKSKDLGETAAAGFRKYIYEELIPNFDQLVSDISLNSNIDWVKVLRNTSALKRSVLKIVKESTFKISQKLEQKLTEWQRLKLQPLLRNKNEQSQREILELVAEFSQDIEGVKRDLAGLPTNEWQDLEPEVMVFTDYGEIISMVIGEVLSWINPVRLMRSLLKEGRYKWREIVKAPSLAVAIRDRTGELLKKSLDLSAMRFSQAIEEKVAEATSRSNKVEVECLAEELEATHTQVKKHLERKKKGSQNLEKELAKCKELQGMIDSIEIELDSLMVDIGTL